MKTINRIMVAVDFSEYSLPAVRYATHLARDVDAELLLVNVINQRDLDMLKRVGGYAPSFSFEHFLKETRRDREESFQQLIAGAGCDDMPVKTSIRMGVPYQELLNAIRSKKPDLLVMAVKGRSNLVDALVGSCARKLFRHSPIPVLSIRGDGSAA